MIPSKKIGILFGQENTFPWAFIDRVNTLSAKAGAGVTAEQVRIDKLVQGEDSGYAVIVDRISQDIPYYRAYLKNAALNGTAVINNPFWWSADEKFFNNCLATKLGVAVPKTVLLPSKQHPPDTTAESMRNLAYPLDWEGIFAYVGFPAYFKPFAGGGWKNVYRVKDAGEFFRAYDETGQLVMMLQEEIVFNDYFRCYCIDRRDVRIMQYDPRQPHHLRYVREGAPVAQAMLDKLRQAVLDLNFALGYDFNTVELAVRQGIPYAIDFCNPAPDAERRSIGEDNFEWVVEAAARMALRRAEEVRAGRGALRWGGFVLRTAAPDVLPAPPTPAVGQAHAPQVSAGPGHTVSVPAGFASAPLAATDGRGGEEGSVIALSTPDVASAVADTAETREAAEERYRHAAGVSAPAAAEGEELRGRPASAGTLRRPAGMAPTAPPERWLERGEDDTL